MPREARYAAPPEFLAADLAVGVAVAGRHPGPGELDGVHHRIVDLTLYRAVARPTGHVRLPSRVEVEEKSWREIGKD